MEEKALKGLLDAFGSVFTLQEIAFAYCTAGRNADLASEYLCEKRTSTSTSTASSCNGEAKGNELLEVSHDNISENQYQANGKYRAPKKKWRPISGGSVSSVIGRDYFKPTQSNNVSCGATKPLKLDASELPMAEIWGDEEAQQKPSKEDHLHKDMEEFLFKMLGEGFQLDRDVIKDVLGKFLHSFLRNFLIVCLLSFDLLAILFIYFSFSFYEEVVMAFIPLEIMRAYHFFNQ